VEQRSEQRHLRVIVERMADAWLLGRAVFDAMAGYAINRHTMLQLNVYNLFDKSYVAAINKSGYRYSPGAPRSAMLTANFRF